MGTQWEVAMKKKEVIGRGYFKVTMNSNYHNMVLKVRKNHFDGQNLPSIWFVKIVLKKMILEVTTKSFYLVHILNSLFSREFMSGFFFFVL